MNQASLGNLREEGMIGRRSLNVGEVLKSIRKAKSITILKTWFPENSTIADALDCALGRLEPATIKLILCHPKSDILKKRCEAAGNKVTLADAQEWILNGLKIVARLANEKQFRGVAFHDGWPGCPVIRADERIYMGFYFCGNSSPHFPWVEIEPDSHFAELLQEQEDHLWRNAKTKLMTPLDLKNWLNNTEKCLESQTMKVGIIGAGFVGAACAKSMLLRGSCHEIVIHDIETKEIPDPKTGGTRTVRKDEGLATDLSHAELLCPHTSVRHGGYEDMEDAAVIVITAGINEQKGKAIDRGDERGRLILLEDNAKTLHKIMDEMKGKVPLDVPILVVTDPPDPLAKIARDRRPNSPVISAGTYLDTLRFQLQIANWLSRDPSTGKVIQDRVISSRSVDAIVIGEHGTSQVYVWSSAQIGGKPVLDMAEKYGWKRTTFRDNVEERVKYANIDIIEGTGASQHGIGVVTARIVEAMLRDEGLVAPVGEYQDERYETTLSLPSVIGRRGVTEVQSPKLSAEEDKALLASADEIKKALNSLPSGSQSRLQ